MSTIKLLDDTGRVTLPKQMMLDKYILVRKPTKKENKGDCIIMSPDEYEQHIEDLTIETFNGIESPGAGVQTGYSAELAVDKKRRIRIPSDMFEGGKVEFDVMGADFLHITTPNKKR